MHKYVQADYLARTRRIYPPHKFAQNETLHVTEYRLLKWSVYSCSARHCYKTAFTVRQLTKPGSRMPDQKTRIISDRSEYCLLAQADVPVVELVYRVFTRMPRENYRRRLRLCCCVCVTSFGHEFNSLVC